MHSVHGHSDQPSHAAGHGHGQAHPHGHTAAPRTEGRLIRYAWVYDPLVWLMARGQTRALRALPLNFAALRRGEQVLDVGCGTGETALAAGRRVGVEGKVYGIDASPEMIAAAKRKLTRKSNLRRVVHFKVEPVEALTFRGSSFDVVLSSLMMHHLPGDLKQNALAEIRRVLKPGGRLVIVDLQATTTKPRFWEPGWLIMQRHGLTAASEAAVRAGQETLAQLLRDAGFEAVEVGTTRYAWLGFAIGKAPASGLSRPRSFG